MRRYLVLADFLQEIVIVKNYVHVDCLGGLARETEKQTVYALPKPVANWTAEKMQERGFRAQVVSESTVPKKERHSCRVYNLGRVLLTENACLRWQ